MITQQVEYKGTIVEVSELTNGIQALHRRLYRALAEVLPELGKTPKDIDRDIAEYVGRFLAGAYVVRVVQGDFPVLPTFATPTQIRAAWNEFLNDDPGLWEAIADAAYGLSQPTTDAVQKPSVYLTDEELADPNSSALVGSTPDSAMKN